MRRNRDGVAVTELITNGGFASGITGWSALDLTIAWQNALSGDGSTGYMRATVTANPNYDRFWQQTTAGGGIAASKTYVCSFWYRTSGVTGNFAVCIASSSGFANGIWPKTLTPQASWTQVSFQFTTTSSSYPYFIVTKVANIGAGYIDIDAISVQEASGNSAYYRANQ